MRFWVPSHHQKLNFSCMSSPEDSVMIPDSKTKCRRRRSSLWLWTSLSLLLPLSLSPSSLAALRPLLPFSTLASSKFTLSRGARRCSAAAPESKITEILKSSVRLEKRTCFSTYGANLIFFTVCQTKKGLLAWCLLNVGSNCPAILKSPHDSQPASDFQALISDDESDTAKARRADPPSAVGVCCLAGGTLSFFARKERWNGWRGGEERRGGWNLEFGPEKWDEVRQRAAERNQ